MKKLFKILLFFFLGGPALAGYVPPANNTVNQGSPPWYMIVVASPTPVNTQTPTPTVTPQNTPGSGTPTWTMTLTPSVTPTFTITPTFSPTQVAYTVPYGPLSTWGSASGAISTATGITLISSGSGNIVILGCTVWSTSTLLPGSFSWTLTSTNSGTVTLWGGAVDATGNSSTAAFNPMASFNYPVYGGGGPVIFNLLTPVTTVYCDCSFERKF
jgi:hypothetical protein